MVKLSVIIPVYGVERYLSQCVESVLRQTLREIEIILVDDQSPDRCPALCDAYAAQDSRVRVVHKENGGLGYARNSGLEIAHGEYVTFLDSDDYVDLNAYDTVCRLADVHRLDTLRFACNRFSDDGVATPERRDATLTLCDDPARIKTFILAIFDSNMPQEDNPTGGSSCMAIYRREMIERHHLRFPSEREYISEDYLFNLAFHQYATRIGSLPNTYYHYRFNPSSLTHTPRPDRMEMCAKYASHLEQQLLRYGYPEACRRYAMAFFIGNTRAACRIMFLSQATLGEKRRWFHRHTHLDYMRRVQALYPIATLPLRQRLCWWTLSHHLFWPTYLLIAGFSRVRKARR